MICFLLSKLSKYLFRVSSLAYLLSCKALCISNNMSTALFRNAPLPQLISMIFMSFNFLSSSSNEFESSYSLINSCVVMASLLMLRYGIMVFLHMQSVMYSGVQNTPSFFLLSVVSSFNYSIFPILFSNMCPKMFTLSSEPMSNEDMSNKFL